MIILNLKGGLGNQIFQYAAALKFASKNKKKLHIYTGNLTAYKTKRNFSLNVFIQNYPFEVVLIESKNILFLKKYFLILLKKISTFIITEKNFFSKSHSFITIVDDYFIDSKFLDSDIVVNFKELLDNNLSKKMDEFPIDEGIGMHIRGTDRLAESQNINYEDILNNISINQNQTLYCFTDDIVYAKNQLKNIKNQIVYLTDFNLSDLEEFYLISKMDKFIVSNSTFSILARRLSSNETSTYIVKDFFATRDIALLDVFNFESTIYYL